MLKFSKFCKTNFTKLYNKTPGQRQATDRADRATNLNCHVFHALEHGCSRPVPRHSRTGGIPIVPCPEESNFFDSPEKNFTSTENVKIFTILQNKFYKIVRVFPGEKDELTIHQIRPFFSMIF